MITELETARGGKVKRLRSDNGGEFLSNNFQRWLRHKGIVHERTAPYSPESNGKAERLQRTLMDMARCLLASATHIPDYQKLWAEAINAANFIRNRMYTTSGNFDNKTPYEVIMGKKPHLSFLRAFGSKAYVHVPKPKQKDKFSPRAKIGYLVGYAAGNSYRVFIPQENGVLVSQDVTFDESLARPNSIGDLELLPEESDQNVDLEESPVREDLESDKSPEESSLETEANKEQVTYNPELPRRSPRISKPPERLEYSAMLVTQSLMGNIDPDVPLSYEQAISSKEGDNWKQAMKDELKSLEENNTWKLVTLPPGHKTVSSKWVFAKKTDGNGNLVRYKARLVARGYSQREGIDYEEVFAPVAKYTTLRFLLALAVQMDLKILQLDVKSAFLNGELQEEIYLKQPEGFSNDSGRVYKLLKALYGLKQAARAWYQTMDNCLRSIKAQPSSGDQSLYIIKDRGNTVYILVYVDDILMFGKDMHVMKQVSQLIGSRFTIRVEENVEKFLGIFVDSATKGRIFIHSKLAIRQLLRNFNMDSAKAVSTPLPPSILFEASVASGNTAENLEANDVPYRQLIGGLLHLSNTTRPDISYAVGFLSRYMENPNMAHWQAAKHILRYLKGTVGFGIEYSKLEQRESPKLVGFTDSDFASDKETRKSTSGYVFMLSGGAISWRSKKQTIVAQSTVEAEYIAMSFAVRELLWLQKICREVNLCYRNLLLYCDNQGAISFAGNGTVNDRTKHVDVKYMFVKDHVKMGTVKLQFIATGEMKADMFTKALDKTKHLYHMHGIGMVGQQEGD